ncbi:putative isomerase YfhB [Leptolinea sp. HRD-7]|nr:putative isomerase YfhB [Leptolinea sp. HRD-7]
MKTLKFKKIDAFTGSGSSGNPAGYIHMDSPGELTDAEMQRIGWELKGFVSEVGFVWQDDGVYNLRYFSSDSEVAFCGHATIAILYDLLKSSPEPQVTFRVKAGDLTAYNRIKEEDAVYITAPAPKYLDHKITVAEAADVLGINPADIDPAMPIRVIDGGLRTLLVPIKTLETVLSMYPNEAKLRQLSLDREFDITHVFTPKTSFEDNAFRVRVFPPRFGYLEDPATGSGNSAFGYYLISENRWPGDMTLEQGPSRENPNIVKIKRKVVNGEERILFGGSATTRITGEYQLHSF